MAYLFFSLYQYYLIIKPFNIPTYNESYMYFFIVHSIKPFNIPTYNESYMYFFIVHLNYVSGFKQHFSSKMSVIIISYSGFNAILSIVLSYS